MHIFKLRRLVPLMLVAMSCGSAVPPFAFANDGGKGEPPAKPAAAAKIEAPAPLTERERWLLDRVEQLEKRVADLESRGGTAAASAADASAVPAASVNAGTYVVAAGTPSIVPGVTVASSGLS